MVDCLTKEAKWPSQVASFPVARAPKGRVAPPPNSRGTRALVAWVPGWRRRGRTTRRRGTPWRARRRSRRPRPCPCKPSRCVTAKQQRKEPNALAKCHSSRLHTCPVTNSPRARVEGGALPRDAQPLLSRVGPHTSSSHSLQPPLSLINPNLHSKFLFIFIFSPHAKQTALLKKRLAEAMVTAQAAAGAGASSLKKEEAMGDVRAISAELMVGRCRLTPGTPWFSQLTPRLLSGTFSS